VYVWPKILTTYYTWRSEVWILAFLRQGPSAEGSSANPCLPDIFGFSWTSLQYRLKRRTDTFSSARVWARSHFATLTPAARYLLLNSSIDQRRLESANTISLDSEYLNQDEYAIVGICRLITIRDTYNYIECPVFIDSRIESTLILRSLDRELEWMRIVACRGEDWKHTDPVLRTDRPFYTSMKCQSLFVKTKTTRWVLIAKGLTTLFTGAAYLIVSRRPGLRELETSQAFFIRRRILSLC